MSCFQVLFAFLYSHCMPLSISGELKFIKNLVRNYLLFKRQTISDTLTILTKSIWIFSWWMLHLPCQTWISQRVLFVKKRYMILHRTKRFNILRSFDTTDRVYCWLVKRDKELHKVDYYLEEKSSSIKIF